MEGIQDPSLVLQAGLDAAPEVLAALMPIDESWHIYEARTSMKSASRCTVGPRYQTRPIG
jgi:hypothetical protein